MSSTWGRRLALLAVLAASTRLPAAGAEPPRPAPPPTTAEVADAVLEASRAGDGQRLHALSRPHAPAPFLVASELWARVLAAPDEAAREEAEAALRAWAEAWRDRPIASGLPAAAARWLAFGAEERARDRVLRALFVRVRDAEPKKDVDAALGALREALPLAEQAPASQPAYDVLAKAGGMLASWGRAEGADAVRRAAEHAERLGSLFLAARCWSYLGKVQFDKGDHAASLASSQQEARLCALVEDRSNQANALVNGALQLLMLERPRESLERAQAAAALAQEVGARKVRMRAEDMLSQAYAQLGDPHAARRAAEEAVALAEQDGDVGRSSEVRFRLAQTLLEQDAWSEAHDLFLALRTRADATADASLALLATAALANLERLLGRHEEALRRAEEQERLASAYFVETDRPALVADAKTSVALSHLVAARRRGDGRADADVLRRGVTAAREAIAVYESVGVRLTRMSATTRLALARLLLALGEREEAIELLEALRKAQGPAGERSSAAALLRDAQALDHLVAERFVEAADAARDSLAIRRHLLRVLAEDDAVANREEAVAAAALVVEALARRQRREPGGSPHGGAVVSQAFQAAESARGLLLTEGLLHDRSVLWRDLPADLVAEDERTRAAVKEARERWIRVSASVDGAREVPPPDPREEAGRALVAAWKARDATVLRVQRAARKASAFVDPPAPDASTTRDAVGDDALVLYQTVGGENAHAIVWRRIGSRLVELGPARTVRARADAWLRLVSTSGADDRAAAAAVYDTLLRPLEPALRGAKRLLLVPDGVLAFVPFEAALRRAAPDAPGSGDERLVARHDVAYLPSVGVLTALRADRPASPGRGVLALGDPDLGAAAAQYPPLTEARAEARALVERVPEAERTLLLGADATVARLLAALGPEAPRRRVVHLACHGLVNPAVPRATGLLLAGGEVLDVDRLGRERWSADLVTLAACDSGRGRVVPGEGVFGLVRAVLLAGAPRVVTSQWRVDDGATRRLMARFYDGLLSGGLPPARALAEAKRQALKDGGADAEPSRWAAFVLWGLPD